MLLTTLFAELIIAYSSHVGGGGGSDALNYFGRAGLLDNMYWIFIVNILLYLFFTFFDVGYFFKLIKQCYASIRGEKNLNMTQIQANE